jgi:ankyrin repeat protein
MSLLLGLGLDPNVADNEGWTPLHFAASHGYRRVAVVLIEAGADLSAPTEAGQQPADLARVNGHDWYQRRASPPSS